MQIDFIYSVCLKKIMTPPPSLNCQFLHAPPPLYLFAAPPPPPPPPPPLEINNDRSLNKTMLERGKKVVMLFGQRYRWRVSSICMNRRQNYGIYQLAKLRTEVIMFSLSGFSILAGTICK